MSQPPFPYNRIFDFESFSIVNPTTQQPGVQIEGELDGVKRTLDSVISRLSEIQRDDGYIRDSALDQSTVIPQFYDRLVLLFNPTFAQIDQKINLKASIASPTFTGVVTIPANAVIVGFAKLASPNFTGVPTTPTPAALSESQQVANAAFVTAAGNAIKQFVADNFLSLDGDQMNANSVIHWTKTTPAKTAPTQYPPNASLTDTFTNKISEDGVLLEGLYQVGGTQSSFEIFTNKRETFITQGSIRLREFNDTTLSGRPYPQNTMKGEIVIWSGESQFSGQQTLPVLFPLSGPHITLWGNGQNYGTNPMMISSDGLQFPDGTNQDTRGMSFYEVRNEASNIVQTAISDLISSAPATLDTLKEIADALGNDTNLAANLTAAIAGKADIVHNHSISEVVGLQEALTSIKIQDYDNFKIYVAGDMVIAENRIFRFNATIGAAGYGPITHPSDWTEQSAAPNLSGYMLKSDNLSGLGSLATARTNLGLGSGNDVVFKRVTLSPVFANPSNPATVHNTSLNEFQGLRTINGDFGVTPNTITYEGRYHNQSMLASEIKYITANSYDYVKYGSVSSENIITTKTVYGNGGTTVPTSQTFIKLNVANIPTLTVSGQNADNQYYHQDEVIITPTSVSVKPYGGNAVQVNKDGIVFADGTTQSTASLTPNVSNTFTQPQTILTPLGPTPGLRVVASGVNAYTSSLSSTVLRVGLLDPNGQGAYGYMSGTELRVGGYDAGLILLDTNNTGGYNPCITLYENGSAAPIQGRATYIKEGKFLVDNNDGNGALEVYAPYSAVNNKADLSGATFSGKVFLPVSSGASKLNIGTGGNETANTTAGDVWIAGTSLNFRDINGSWRQTLNSTSSANITVNNNTFPALRLTQTGTANSFVVEDSATPDANAFIIDNAGNVGVGVPSTFTATSKVEVVGNVKASSFSSGSGPAFSVTSIQGQQGGAHTHDIYMSVNGSTYRIPAIFVSTP